MLAFFSSVVWIVDTFSSYHGELMIGIAGGKEMCVII